MNHAQANEKWATYRSRIFIVDGDFRRAYIARAGSADISFEPTAMRTDLLSDVAESFLDSGAEVLVTPTAELNAIKQAAKKVTADQLVTLNRDAVAAYRKAINTHPRGSDAMLLGAIGPVDELLTLGEIDEAKLEEAYRSQTASLIEGGVDAIICRGFTELSALQAAIRAAQSGQAVPIIATMTFDCGPDLTDTAMGVSPAQACELLVSMGVVAIGADGGQSPDTAALVVKKLRDACDLPLWATITPGVMQLEEGAISYPEQPKEYAARYKTLTASGTNFIGGSTGATTAHITALADAKKSDKKGRLQGKLKNTGRSLT